MAIYDLEEDPDVFITPHLWDNKFLYRMEHFDAMENRKTTHHIDLRSDKLMVYGTEIKESMLQRLSESLILKSRAGILYVNCKGACYFLLTGEGCHRPIHNVIFDWSQFGVTIPNSVVDSLRKQLGQKEEELGRMKQQLSSLEVSLEASNKEVKELEGQLLACRKEKQEMEVDLRKVSGQLPLIGFELEISKIELESYKKEVKELEDQLFTCMEESENMKLELQKLQELELSKERMRDFEEQLSIYKKKRQDMEDQLSLANQELQYTKTQLESSEKMVSDHLWSINSEVRSTNQRLDQLLTSTLWNGLERCHLAQPIRLQAGTRYTLPVIHELYDSMNNNLPIIFMATDDDDVPEQSSNDMKLDSTRDY